MSGSASAVVVALGACRQQTQILIEAWTDIPCAQVQDTSIVVSSETSLVRRDPASPDAVTSACGGGRIGSLAVDPGPDLRADGYIARVVVGVTSSALRCRAPDYEGCSVQRRRLRFRDGEAARLRVSVLAECIGKPCDERSTCVRGGGCVTVDEFAARCGENGDCPLDASSEIPEASLRDAELDDRADWRDDGSAPEDGSADPREAASDVGSQGEAGDTGVEDGAVSDAGADAPFDACALGICEDFSGDASLAARGWSTVDSQGRLSIVHDDGGDGLAIDLGRTGNFMAYVSRPWDAAAPPIRCAFTLRMNLPEPDAGSDYLVDPLVLSAGNGDELYTRLFTRRGSNTWTVYLGTNGLGAPSGTKLEVSSFIPAPVVFQLESSLYSGNTAGSLAANGSLATAPLDGGFPARTMFPSTVNVNLGVSRFAVPVAGASLVLSKVRCVPE